jgi:DNA-binding beta-propeller fold protein YncE
MTRLILSIAVGIILLLPEGPVTAEPLTFNLPTGINPVYLNQSKKFFSNPSGISVNPDGAYLLIADPDANEIKVLDTGRLRLLSQFGKNDLNSPQDVAFDSKGKLLVADSKNNRIMIYRFEGVFRDGSANIEHLSTLSESLSSPMGVAGSTDGRVYVANTGSNAVTLFKDGKISKQVTTAGAKNTPLSGPADVHVDTLGRVLVADNGNRRILIFDRDLNFKQELSPDKYGFGSAGRMTSDENGLVLIADPAQNQIRITGPDFQPLGRIVNSPERAGQLRGTGGVETVGRYMWVTDTGNKRVILFRRE